MIESLHTLPNIIRIAHRIASGSKRQHGGWRRRLRERNVDASIPAGALQFLVNIPDNPNDLGRLFVDASDQQSLTNRVLSSRVVWPKLPRQVLIDHSNSLRSFPIAFRECSASPKWDLKRGKIIGRHNEYTRNGALVQRQWRLIGTLNRCSRIAGHWQLREAETCSTPGRAESRC